MKEIRTENTSTLIIPVGIDFGASRIKVSYKDKVGNIKDFQFPNKFKFENVISTGYVVENEAEKFVIGCYDGISNLRKRKVNYDYLTEILHIINVEIRNDFNGEEIKLNINTVLPPDQLKESKQAFRELLLQANETEMVINKVHSKLKIEDIKVGCEGIMVLKTFNLNSIIGKADNVLLIDVGSSTTDVIILNKINSVWQVQDGFTYEQGGSHICKSIAHYINSKESGLSYDSDKLERAMSYQLDGEVYSIVEHIECADEYVKGLLTVLSKIDNIRQYRIVLAGGASRLLRENELFNQRVKGYISVKEELLDYGNSRGALLSHK